MVLAAGAAAGRRRSWAAAQRVGRSLAAASWATPKAEAAPIAATGRRMRTPGARVGETGEAAVDPCGAPGQSPPAVDVKRDAIYNGVVGAHFRQLPTAPLRRLLKACLSPAAGLFSVNDQLPDQDHLGDEAAGEG